MIEGTVRFFDRERILPMAAMYSVGMFTTGLFTFGLFTTSDYTIQVLVCVKGFAIDKFFGESLFFVPGVLGISTGHIIQKAHLLGDETIGDMNLYTVLTTSAVVLASLAFFYKNSWGEIEIWDARNKVFAPVPIEKSLQLNQNFKIDKNNVEGEAWPQNIFATILKYLNRQEVYKFSLVSKAFYMKAIEALPNLKTSWLKGDLGSFLEKEIQNFVADRSFTFPTQNIANQVLCLNSETASTWLEKFAGGYNAFSMIEEREMLKIFSNQSSEENYNEASFVDYFSKNYRVKKVLLSDNFTELAKSFLSTIPKEEISDENLGLVRAYLSRITSGSAESLFNFLQHTNQIPEEVLERCEDGVTLFEEIFIKRRAKSEIENFEQRVQAASDIIGQFDDPRYGPAFYFLAYLQVGEGDRIMDNLEMLNGLSEEDKRSILVKLIMFFEKVGETDKADQLYNSFGEYVYFSDLPPRFHTKYVKEVLAGLLQPTQNNDENPIEVHSEALLAYFDEGENREQLKDWLNTNLNTLTKKADAYSNHHFKQLRMVFLSLPKEYWKGNADHVRAVLELLGKDSQTNKEELEKVIALGLKMHRSEAGDKETRDLLDDLLII